MTDSNTNKKQLVFVSRSGPAFSLSEIAKAHAKLDLAGAPRRIQGRRLSLPERIAALIDVANIKNQPGRHSHNITS